MLARLTQWMLTPAGMAFDRWLVRWLGVSLLNTLFARSAGFTPQPALLMTTIGRKSGAPRSVALPYFQIGGQLMVVGSKGGAPTDPAWVTNLRHNPSCQLHINAKPHRAIARIAQGEQYEQFWETLCNTVPTYRGYAESAAPYRSIPVVLLELLD